MVTLVHIVSSDEVLLQQEACGQIIATVNQADALEHQIIDVVKGFEWDEVLQASQSLSLFAHRQLFDIRFSGIPDKAAQNALAQLTASADADNLYLIRLPLLKKKQMATKWFKLIVHHAEVNCLYPPNPNQYQSWLIARARKESIQLQPQAAHLLAEQTEENLLAASQAINKLAILYPDQTVDSNMLEVVLLDSSRYNVFKCCDQALLGNGKKAVTMMHSIRQESVAPIILLSSMARSVRCCTELVVAKQKRQPTNAVFSQNKVWGDSVAAITRASQNVPFVLFQKILVRLAFLDRMIKGQEKGDVWREFESCLWLLSGKRIWGAK